jgi:hypothetical protein
MPRPPAEPARSARDGRRHAACRSLSQNLSFLAASGAPLVRSRVSAACSLTSGPLGRPHLCDRTFHHPPAPIRTSLPKSQRQRAQRGRLTAAPLIAGPRPFALPSLFSPLARQAISSAARSSPAIRASCSFSPSVRVDITRGGFRCRHLFQLSTNTRAEMGLLVYGRCANHRPSILAVHRRSASQSDNADDIDSPA